MDLKNYMKEKNLTNADIAAAFDISIATVMRFKHREGSPSLLHTLKIYAYSSGEISFEDMLSKEDLKKLKNWIDDVRKKHYRVKVKKFIENLLASSYKEGIDVQEIHTEFHKEYRKKEVQRDFEFPPFRSRDTEI